MEEEETNANEGGVTAIVRVADHPSAVLIISAFQATQPSPPCGLFGDIEFFDRRDRQSLLAPEMR